MGVCHVTSSASLLLTCFSLQNECCFRLRKSCSDQGTTVKANYLPMQQIQCLCLIRAGTGDSTVGFNSCRHMARGKIKVLEESKLRSCQFVVRPDRVDTGTRTGLATHSTSTTLARRGISLS
ncbi:uncharacterized protein F4812DRAFT_427953 [Daldinia caldariorum]|uniref:uncharacterized protein n=1 Tax=Daldinia caldariorum TaxID=326644 RepID=UPI0020078771|nr:uncharacterized protein F4812DRAFT_427953 [Daldinia caldariorum]KAI1467872.1 hypothetical protein F4812DRAFT_427953 [Daldinia caldariorum]